MVLEQSGSSTAIKNIVKVTAAAVQRLRARWTRTDKIKKYATGSQLKEIWSKIIYCTKEQNLGSAAGATAVLGYPAILLGPRFLVSWFSLWFLGSRFFVFCLWVLLRIWGFCEFIENSAQQQPVRSRVVFLVHWVHLKSRCITLCPQQFVFALLAKEQASPVRQILVRGAMVPTLLPVTPGPLLVDVGLIWVCQCHCPLQGAVVRFMAINTVTRIRLNLIQFDTENRNQDIWLPLWESWLLLPFTCADLKFSPRRNSDLSEEIT